MRDVRRGKPISLLASLEVRTHQPRNYFRRLRPAVLKKYGCAEDLRKFWLGHENRDISDEYAEQLLDDIERRQEVVARVGLGLEIPEPSSVPNVPKTLELEAVEVAA